MLSAVVVYLVGGGALVLLVSVGAWMIRAEQDMTPETVARRAAVLMEKQTAQRIAETGEATRQAIREAAERRRRDRFG
ncbi:hypothetical protein ACQPXM_33785 [Kribbella sp. CA-253562]|uniref:hypothetical protein n=1 Tax=Kribbella sp. CA-253562 TaxID=3239942 RepID=UPI003D921DC6